MMDGITRRGMMGCGLAVAAAPMLPHGARAAADDNPMPPELRQVIEHEGLLPVLGNAAGKVTLTEFFDYNCPFCRATVPDLARLITSDPELRVVFHEWPVFGEGSEFTARLSLATLKQGKYWQFHKTMMATKGEANETSALRVAGDVGLDLARLKRDMEAPDVLEHIQLSNDLADHMGLIGTPTFIAGNDARFGRQSLDDLRTFVAEARRALM